MTTTQWVFVVFFAIFWGAIASVQGRWKMFHWPLIAHCHVFCRVLLSIAVLNILPTLFFGLIFFVLRNTPVTQSSAWSFGETLRQVIAGVAPAFAVFGFYRLWLAIVEFTPTTFYQNSVTQTAGLADVEPTIEFLKLCRTWRWWNLTFAILYLVLATVVPVCLVR